MAYTTFAQVTMESLLSNGAIGGALLLIYILVDKVIVPLIKERTGKSASSPNGSRIDDSSQTSKQEYINEQLTRRIEQLEHSSEEIRTRLSEVGTAIRVSEAILKRLESKDKK